MRTLFILSIASGYGGAERSIEIMLRHMPPGVAVHVYAESALHIERLMRPGGLPQPVRLVRTTGSETLWGRRRAALRLVRDVLKHRPQAVLVNTHGAALIAAMAAKVVADLGPRSILYVRDFLWRDLDYIFGRLSGARVIAPSAVVAQRIGYLTPFYLTPVGLSSFEVFPDMVEVPSGDVHYDGPFLHLATINPWKGHIDLMLALHELKRQGTAASARSVGVVGHSELKARIRQLGQALELDDTYRLEPYVADPDPLLRSCRAVVAPSVSHSGGPETFGRATIEAWAYRKPVIAYATGATAHLIEDGVDGLLVPEGDIQALAGAIGRLNASPDWSRRLGEAGYAKVLRHYEAGSVTRRLLDRLLPDQDTHL